MCCAHNIVPEPSETLSVSWVVSVVAPELVSLGALVDGFVVIGCSVVGLWEGVFWVVRSVVSNVGDAEDGFTVVGGFTVVSIINIK